MTLVERERIPVVPSSVLAPAISPRSLRAWWRRDARPMPTAFLRARGFFELLVWALLSFSSSLPVPKGRHENVVENAHLQIFMHWVLLSANQNAGFAVRFFQYFSVCEKHTLPYPYIKLYSAGEEARRTRSQRLPVGGCRVGATGTSRGVSCSIKTLSTTT